jgi:ADP-ribosylglycohydrolase
VIIENYEEQVYAGVLGKVIGVYMGRPFEGWPKEKLVARWGLVDRYVHEEQRVPLVVSDDDITGTFTFVRILQDSGLYAKTPVERFGDNWLNYIVPNKSILWWGGMGVSTEHTAFIRLVNGVKAPFSGCAKRNGQTVAEQIGAQIFIDAFGLVAPGKPALAADLARKAASVSHDGEAVHGAVVVAAMVSAAFVEKDMERLLDAGVEQIPSDSLIAQVHRDVREWCAKDRDWEKTWARIDKTYGYHIYGGNCHIIPNHAIMVMAWCYAPDDFQMSQAIINTAGWDTDCNAANVGSVMGVKVGLDGINAQYDFQGPFADRLVLPTAEGTRSVSDCLTEALHIAAAGRSVMGWDAVPAPKEGALFHFSLPGALHGFMSEDTAFQTRGGAVVSNVSDGEHGRVMLVEAVDLCRGKPARVSTPVMPEYGKGGYGAMGTSRLYPGMTIEAQLRSVSLTGPASARLFVRTYDQECRNATVLLYGTEQPLSANATMALSLTVPDTSGLPVCGLGIELNGVDHSSASLLLDRVVLGGAPRFSIEGMLPSLEDGTRPGWINDVDNFSGFVMNYRFPGLQGIGRNQGRGHFVTGTTDWSDYSFESELVIHCADGAGIMVRYQGLRRYLALVKTQDEILLVRRCYEETVLARAPLTWDVDTLHTLMLTARGPSIVAFADGGQLFKHTETELTSGGAGFVVDTGVMGVKRLSVAPV